MYFLLFAISGALKIMCPGRHVFVGQLHVSQVHMLHVYLATLRIVDFSRILKMWRRIIGYELTLPYTSTGTYKLLQSIGYILCGGFIIL